jgi:transposase
MKPDTVGGADQYLSGFFSRRPKCDLISAGCKKEVRTNTCPVSARIRQDPFMAEQHVLDLPPAEHTGGVEIVFVNAHCQIQSVESQRLVVVRGLPIHRFAVDDSVARDYAMVLIVEAGHAQQNEVAAAFGCSIRTVRRHQKRYAEGGMAALAMRTGWRPGRRRISRTRDATIRRLHEKGDSNRKIARKLGIDEKAVRKQVGPSVRCTQVEMLEDPPSPESLVETDNAPEPAEYSAADQDWSCDVSADTDPTDRTMDRVLAKLGMLDDAPPLFRDASAVPGAGVLFALPFLVQSGIFQVSKKLYGSIGPAFYGLRTSMLALLLMALWRIKRPEWLKERDPAMLGCVLGLDRAPEVKTLRRKLTRLAAFE